MVSMDEFANAFGFDAKSNDTWVTLGKVQSVSGNTLSVKLGGSTSNTDCEAYCLADVGDIVLVVITNGSARAVGVKGGGNHVYHSNVDAKAADNGVTQTIWPGDVYGFDSNGLRTSFFGESVYPNGDIAASIYAYNYDSSGNRVATNYFNLLAKKDGTTDYYIPNKAAFCNALGLNTWSSVTAANWYEPATGLSTHSDTVIRYNAALGIVQIRLRMQATSSLTAAGHTLGTVKSDYRPKNVRVVLPSLTSASYPAYIDTNGTITANTAAVSANGYLYYCGEYHIGG